MSTVRIALANARFPATAQESIALAEQAIAQASAAGAAIVCFPECFVPGYRAPGKPVPPPDGAFLERAWSAIAKAAAQARVAVVLGTERFVEGSLVATALVINQDGSRAGFQDKVQIDPSEEGTYTPGAGRRVFQAGPVTFGVAICHEGWRYPETVRWAAARGARIVFHPQHTGNERAGMRLTRWGQREAPYYEQAMLMRSRENTIYFASVNYALRYPESATSLIGPSGECQAYLPYGQEGVLVQALKLEDATGLLASRYAPERYREDP
jgi:predicted amidohydrolase